MGPESFPFVDGLVYIYVLILPDDPVKSLKIP